MQISHPPPIRGFQIVHSTRLRFVSNAAFDGFITWKNLMDLIGFSSSAVAGWQVFQIVRLRCVEVWAVPVASNATTVSVTFDGQALGQAGDERTFTDTSMGIQPAHIRAKPSPKSQTGQFQAGSANAAFLLQCPSGSVVDVCLTYRGQFGSATSETNATVGATTGAMFLRGLDGVAIAATKLVPQGTDATF